MFNAAAALGEALGPTLGTWLLAQGFQRGTQLLTLLLVIYALATHCSEGKGGFRWGEEFPVVKYGEISVKMMTIIIFWGANGMK